MDTSDFDLRRIDNSDHDAFKITRKDDLTTIISWAEIKLYKDDLHTLEQYLDMKVLDRDWHAVSDAANDIRVLEERIKILESTMEKIDNAIGGNNGSKS